jgi:beta-lactamase regulating signal transducer with metallopeptidase domain
VLSRISLSNVKCAGRRYVLLHERTHLRRRDHIIKFVSYFILCVHYFNPLAWAAFILMGADMEMSCDEKVLKEMGGEAKRGYSLALLSL